MSSDAWDEIGTREKLGTPQIPSTPPDAMRVKNLELLRDLKEKATSYEEIESMVRVKVESRVFEFWPSSDTWFSYPKSRYGTDISSIVRMIRRVLLREGKSAGLSQLSESETRSDGESD